jgi:hypothetical protein
MKSALLVLIIPFLAISLALVAEHIYGGFTRNGVSLKLPKIQSAGVLGLIIGIGCVIAGFSWGWEVSAK